MYNKKKSKINKHRVFIIIVFVLMIVNIIFIYFNKKLTPIIQAIGEYRAQDIITNIISESVNEVIKEGIVYEDLINIEKDRDGNIILIQADTAMLNLISSNVTSIIQERLEEIEDKKEYIPLGNITNSQILAQYGPKFRLRMTPIGSVKIKFGNEFKQSGINQVRHSIFLVINTKVKVIVPFNSNDVEISSNMPLTEVIIVGKVPTHYFNIFGDDMHNIMPLYWK
ncbi:MAG: sporulation protein YunB [Clostridiales bacterium]|nr:sporulation protein YunB [Clostridiales bacterium]